MQDLFDENINHLHEIKREAEQALRFFERLENMFSKNAEKLPAESFLTGDITDIANCEKGLNKAEIESLPPDTKEQLLKNLEQAEKQGLVEIDFENKKVLLTDKGNEFMSRPEFQRQLSENISKIKKAEITQYGAEFTGTEKDLLFFKNNKFLDVGAINFKGANKNTVQKFADNLKKWHEKGIIKIGKDMKISLTPKGENLIKSAEFAGKFGSNFAEKVLSAIPKGKLIVITKQVATAAKNAVITASNAAKGGD
jgi:predicted transcriptional regulator